MIVASTSLLRGAGYVTFNGDVPEQTEQAALAADYAHVTAPLRRLVDRFGLEICVAICAGQPVPQWVLDALPDLPGLMQEAGRKSSSYEHAVLDLVEAHVLKDSVGQTFTGVITEVDREESTKGVFVIQEPAIEASIRGDDLPLGEQVRAKLVVADPVSRQVRFALSG